MTEMQVVKTILLLLLSLVFWSATFAMIGYAFLSFAPCHWFGSSFEGTCGYRGALLTALVCALLAIGMSVFTVFGHANKSAAV